MSRYTTRDVYCYLWLQERVHWKMSVQQDFISIKQLHSDKPSTDSNENKKEQNLNNTKTFPYCFDTIIRRINIFKK